MRTGVKYGQLRQILTELADQHGGSLTEDQVIDYARPENSPLHPYFEWNKDNAHKKFLRIQARSLIQQVRFEVRTREFKVRAPVFVRNPNQHAYTAVARLKQDNDVARSVVVTEFVRAASALRRARAVAAAFGLEEEVTAAQANIDSMLGRVRTSISDEAAGSA